MKIGKFLIPLATALAWALPFAALPAAGQEAVAWTDNGKPIAEKELAATRSYRGVHFREGLSFRSLGLTDLALADFTDARMRHVDLEGCELQGADFTRADLTGARLPDGFLERKDVVFKDTALGPKGLRVAPSVSRDLQRLRTSEIPPTYAPETRENKTTSSPEKATESSEGIQLQAFFSTEGNTGDIRELDLSEDGTPFRLAAIKGGLVWGSADKRSLHMVKKDTHWAKVIEGGLVDLGPMDGNFWLRTGGKVPLHLAKQDLLSRGDGRNGLSTAYVGLAEGPPPGIGQVALVKGCPTFISSKDGKIWQGSHQPNSRRIDYTRIYESSDPILSIRTSAYGDLLLLTPFGPVWIPGADDVAAKIFRKFASTFPDRPTDGTEQGRPCVIRWSKYRILLHWNGFLYLADLTQEAREQGVHYNILNQSTPVAIHDMAVGPDGCVWFTEPKANRIGRLATDGRISHYPLPRPLSVPTQIVDGGDGKMYFLEAGGKRIGSILATPFRSRIRKATQARTLEIKVKRSSPSERKDPSWKTSSSSSSSTASSSQVEGVEEVLVDEGETGPSLPWLPEEAEPDPDTGGLEAFGISWVRWLHIRDAHFYGARNAKGQFLAKLSAEGKVEGLLRQALREPTYPPFQSLKHKGNWVLQRTFDHNVGYYYEKGKWLATRHLLVALSPDGTEVRTAFPVKSF